jgi:outer membrane protein assembly factor BamB
MNVRQPLAARITIVAASALAFAGSSAHADDWLSHGLDGSRARISAEISGSHFDAGSWQHAWKTEPQLSYRAIVATPSAGDGYLAFATQRNLVRVIRETDGELVWETKTGGTVFASPAIWRGLAFVMGGGQQLVALRLSDGGIVWKKDLGFTGQSSPLVVDGSLFIVTTTPTPLLWRIDAVTGQTLWQASDPALNTAALASAAIADGHVLMVQMEGQVFSFAIADGKRQWMTETHGRVTMSSPLVVGNRVYVLPVSDRARLHALDLATGAPITGWPLDIEVPAPDPGFGLSRERKYVVSSPAGSASAIVLAVRADDYFGMNLAGEPDTFVSQEQLVLVDGENRKVLWSKANGRLETRNPNAVPNFELLSTPALFRSSAGELYMAAASSVAASLRVFSANGDERWNTALSAPTRSSPIFANGRLMIATDAGVVHGFLSATNQPPRAPELGLTPSSGGDSDAASTTLAWGAALDPEGQPVRYQVRVDDDGEILRDWDLEVTTAPDVRSLALPPLAGGSVYTFAVRARDSAGAQSAWSDLHTFHAVGSPTVTVNGRPAASLAEALANATAGGIIRLGAGVFPLSSTLQIPAGVALQGAGPHLTTLNGKGLAIAVAPDAGSELRQLTITGARTGVQVSAAKDVHLRNLILRDNAEIGLDVADSGSADLISASVVRNGIGVRAAGTTQVRNSLITANDVGLQGTATGLLGSRYDNVYDNHADDYRNVARGDGDLGLAVRFEQDDATELRLRPAQPTTDHGDPTDEFAAEPSPNGGRINIGAFGNTTFAELSVPGADASAADAGAGGPDGGTTAPAPDGAESAIGAQNDGCSCSFGRGTSGPAPAWLVGFGLVALARLLRRR